MIKSDHFKSERIIILVLSVVFFMASLTQPICTIGNSSSDDQMIGFMALLLGWMDLFGPGISWIANPLLFLCFVFLLSNKIKTTLILSFLSVCFSLSFLLFSTIYVDEGGHKGPIAERNIGYWLWVSSCAIVFIGALNLFQNLKKAQI